MRPLTVKKAKELNEAFPRMFADVDFTKTDGEIKTELSNSIVQEFDNDAFANCLHFAFSDVDAWIQDKQRLMKWARKNGFMYLDAGRDSATVDVWGEDDTVIHASRRIDPHKDMWASVMGADAKYGLTHPRAALSESSYGAVIASFVHEKNWNSGWMHDRKNLKM